MSQIRLVLSDMDGTLLHFGAHEVSERTMAGVAALREAGIAFGPSSGRELSDLIRYFHGDERCVATGIMGNGKLVYLDGELVYRRPLPRDQVEALARAVWTLPGAVLNFYLMGLTVQKVVDTPDDDLAKSRMKASYTQRMLMQVVWCVIAIVAPCFQFVAGMIPLLFPSLGIKIMAAAGMIK